MTRNVLKGTCAMTAVLAMTALVAFTTARTTASAPRAVDATVNVPPATEVIALGSELWRLDTTSGAGVASGSPTSTARAADRSSEYQGTRPSSSAKSRQIGRAPAPPAKSVRAGPEGT